MNFAGSTYTMSCKNCKISKFSICNIQQLYGILDRFFLFSSLSIHYDSFPNFLDAEYLSTVTLHKKWSFLLRISSVNVTKSTGKCEFGHIYWRNP